MIETITFKNKEYRYKIISGYGNCFYFFKQILENSDIFENSNVFKFSSVHEMPNMLDVDIAYTIQRAADFLEKIRKETLFKCYDMSNSIVSAALKETDDWHWISRNHNFGYDSKYIKISLDKDMMLLDCHIRK